MDEIIPIEFREGKYIRIKGIPHDLTENEANRIAEVIKAMVERKSQ